MRDILTAGIGVLLAVVLFVVGSLVQTERQCQQDKEFVATAAKYFSATEQLVDWVNKVNAAAKPDKPAADVPKYAED